LLVEVSLDDERPVHEGMDAAVCGARHFSVRHEGIDELVDY